MLLTGVAVNDTRKRIADPVDEKLLAGFSFLREDYLFSGSLFPIDIFGAEAAVTVPIGITWTVFLFPDVLEINPLAGL